MVHLYDFWFVVVAVFWIGFFILEGFDFGVGMLHSFVGRNDLERRVAVNTIGPVWDGNEVWLVVAGAAIFAAFPAWYATMFSTFYLVMVLVLVALIGRGLSFEFRGKTADLRWQAIWQWSLTIGSALVPLLLGTGLGDLLFGLPIDENGNYTGSFIQLLVPFGLYTGVTLTILCLFLGATYLTLKTTGELRDRTARLSGRLGWLAALVVLGWVVWSHLGLHEGFVPQPIDILAILAAVAGAWFAESRSEGATFAAGAVALAGVVGSIFFDLFPRVMVSSTDPANSLTVAGIGQPRLHPQGHDGGRIHLHADRPRLPGLEPVDLPEAARCATPAGSFAGLSVRPRWRSGGWCGPHLRASSGSSGGFHRSTASTVNDVADTHLTIGDPDRRRLTRPAPRHRRDDPTLPASRLAPDQAWSRIISPTGAVSGERRTVRPVGVEVDGKYGVRGRAAGRPQASGLAGSIAEARRPSAPPGLRGDGWRRRADSARAGQRHFARCRDPPP